MIYKIVQAKSYFICEFVNIDLKFGVDSIKTKILIFYLTQF